MIKKGTTTIGNIYFGSTQIGKVYRGSTEIWSGIKYKTITGNPATFSDGADNKPIKSLKASIEPVQDLHGYDNPWPSGGGKNKLPNNATMQSINGLTVTVNYDLSIHIKGTASARTNISIFGTGNSYADMRDIGIDGAVSMSGCPTYGSSSTYSLRASIRTTQDVLTEKNDIGGGALFTLDSSNGDRIHVYARIESGANVDITFYPQIELGSTATSYSPYSNICPISGWTGATVQRSGKNLFDQNNLTNQYINNDGSRSSSSVWRMFTLNNPILNNSYTFSATVINASYGIRIVAYDANDNVLSNRASSGTGRVFVTINPPSDTTTIRMCVRDTIVETAQLEYGSTMTDYEQYKTTVVVPVSWQSAAGTVYGGTVDVISGELVVDRTMVDLGSLNWSYNTGSGGYFAASTSPAKAVGITNVICDIYKTSQSASVSEMEDTSIKGAVNNASVFVRDFAYTDAASFKSNASGHQLCYELATPITYQLTPQEVRTLLGNNVIGADCGPVEVTYQAI